MPSIGIGNRIGKSLRTSWTQQNYITALSVLTTGDTTQTITATIVGTGFDLVSFEYSTDAINYTEKGTSANGVYNATGLTADTVYFWRPRLKKGSSYSPYSFVVQSNTTREWYLKGGLSSSDIVGAWKATGVINENEALENILSPGTGDLVKTGAVTWSKTTGWAGFSFLKYLTGPNYKSNTYSVIIKFTNGASTQYCRVIDAEPDNSGTKGMFIIPAGDATLGYVRQGNDDASFPRVLDGVIALTQSSVILNGVFDETIVPTGVEVEIAFRVGCMTFDTGSKVEYFRGQVQALVVYNKDITDAQAIAVTTKMNHALFNSTTFRHRDFSALVRYSQNPIIVHNTEVWNTYGTDAPYAKYENKIGNKWYAPTQISIEIDKWENIAMYTSEDLINWTALPIPVISAVADTWEDNYLLHPNIIKIGAVWYMYYSASDNAGNHKIGVATSSDLINWTKHASNPIYTPPSGHASVPAVILIGSTYYMYYWDRTGNNNSLRYATSADGITWAYGGVAITSVSGEWDYGKAILDPFVIKNKNDVYEMVYTTYLNTGAIEQYIGYAISVDGITWHKLSNFILQKGATWEAGYVGDPVLLEKPDGSAILYYAGVENDNIPVDSPSDGGLCFV